MRHVKKIALIALVAAAGLAVLTGCFNFGFENRPPVDFNGTAPASAEQLHGRWNLTEIHTSELGAATSRRGPWTGGYHIHFNSNGTFQEKDYWNDGGNTTGNWELNGSTLTFTNGVRPSGSLYAFVGTRTVQIAIGNVNSLRITYTRTQDGNTWTYTQTYVRA